MDIEEHLKDMHWEHGLKSFLTAAENINQLRNEAQMWKDIAEFLAAVIADKRYLGEHIHTGESVIDYAVELQQNKVK